jgi:hypothetical protein
LWTIAGIRIARETEELENLVPFFKKKLISSYTCKQFQGNTTVESYHPEEH